MKYNSLYIPIVVLIFMTIVGCKDKETAMVVEEETKTAIDSVITSVTVTEAQFKNSDLKIGKLKDKTISGILKASGHVEVLPQDYAEVSTYIGGVVKSILVQEGDFVKKGQTILRLEHPDFVKLQQEYLTSKNRLSYLKKEYDRQKLLFENKAGKGKVFQEVESNFNIEKGVLRSLKQQLSILSISTNALDNGTISRTVSIKSPIKGYVNHINVSIGSFTEPKIVLFDVTNVENLIVSIDIFSKDAIKVKNKQQITIHLPNQEEVIIKGEIFSIGKKVHNKTKTVSIKANIIADNTSALIPGMFVNAEIEVSNGVEKVLPESAVIRNGAKQFVFIATDEWCKIPDYLSKPTRVSKPKKEMPIDSMALSYEMIEIKTKPAQDGYVGIISDLDMSEYFLVTQGSYYLMSALKSGETVGCCAVPEETE